LVPKNSAFRPETQALHHFIFLRSTKCSKTLQIIIWVQWSRMVALVTKPYLQLWYPPNSAFRAETQVLHLFTFQSIMKCSKHSQSLFSVQWSRMDASVTKPYSQLRYPNIVQSGPKHEFRIFVHSEGIRNAEKHSQSSFWVHWSRIDALVTKPYSQLRYPQIVHLGQKHMFLHLFSYWSFSTCSRTLPIITLGPLE
jgi:hypothetical protein